MNDQSEFRVEPARERWVTVHTWELHARLATHPVTLGEYRLFLTATERPLPPAPAHHEATIAEPIVEVSQLDAAAYCDWLGEQEGAVYRLPSLPELHALECHAEDEGFSAADLAAPPRRFGGDAWWLEATVPVRMGDRYRRPAHFV